MMKSFRLKKISRHMVAIGLVSGLLLSSHAHAITLMQAYQAALKNDPQYQAAIAENNAGKEYRFITKAGLLPIVQFSYNTSRNRGETIAPPSMFNPKGITPQDYRSTSKALNLRQPLINFESQASYQKGQLQSDLSEVIFDAKRQELFLRLITAYTEAEFAQDQLRLYTAQRDAYLEQKRMNDKLFEKGEGTKTEVLETQAKLDIAEALLMEVTDNLMNAKNNLASIVGQEVEDLDALREDFSVLPMERNAFEDWRMVAESHSADIKSAKLGLEIANKEVYKAKAGHAPRVDLNASVSRGESETVQTVKQNNNIRSLGVSVVIPIYSGGYTSAVARQAVALKEKAQSELDAAMNRTMTELRKQFNLLKSSASKIQAFEKSVASGKLLVEATQQSIKGGVRINMDLLNAQQQLVSAKRDLAQAKYTYLTSYLKLKSVAGVLDEKDLQNVASYFVSSAP